MTTTTTPPRRAGRKEWIGLAVIALPCLVYAMDMTILNVALPSISAQLRPSASQLLWIVDVYGFLVAGFLITMGNLGDRIGRRRLLMIGAAAFAAASLVAAFSNSAPMLIAMRALLGIAGATLAPSTLSLIRNMFEDDHQRQFAVGLWIASFSAGGALGPVLGGVMLEHAGWGSVFLPAVPVMGLLLLLGPWLLPEFRDPGAGRIDLPSVALSLVAVLSGIYGLKRIAEHGPDILPIATLAAGLAIGLVFVRRQSTLVHPLLDLKLFRLPIFRAAIAAYGMSCLAMFGVYIFITQYLQLTLALTPLQAGLAVLPWSLGFVVGSLAAPSLARRFAPATVLVAGLAAGAVGLGMLTLIDHPWGLWMLIAGTLVMSLGMAPVFTVGTELIITAAPPERAGAASAIAETASEFFGAFGVAVLGSFGTLLYRRSVGSALPAGLDADAAEQAMSTIGGAHAVARGLDAAAGQALLAHADGAFTDALQAVAGTGAVVIVAACVLSARILRNGPGAALAPKQA